MTVKAYDPRDYVMSLDGTDIHGFAEGDFINVEYESDAFLDVVGSQGDVVRILSHDKRATATLTLQQTSDSNDFLSGIAVDDRLKKDGVKEFILKNVDTDEEVFAAHAWVMKSPALGASNELSNREWTIRLAKAEMNLKGGVEL